jgi:hypothetical protein
MSDIERRIADFLREEVDRIALFNRTYERVLRRAKVRRVVTVAVAGLAVISVGIAGVVTAGTLRAPSSIGPASPGDSPAPSATVREIGGCPVTIPPQPAFVPPQPYPPQPSDVYQSVWYGTAALWTMLGPEGEVWQDLPDDDDDGRFTQKTFWWSDGYPPRKEPTPPITVIGRRLDRPGSFEVGGPAGGGFRRGTFGSFMLVGIEIPAGCWELTATYRGAELSYVVLVEG